MIWTSLIALATASTALAAGSYPSLQVRNAGVPVGQFKNVSGIQMYHSYPPGKNTTTKALIHLTDIYGVPLLENQLLADSLAANDYLVIMPDLFAGDAIPTDYQEKGLNLTDWRARHPGTEIDRITNVTMGYMREMLGVQKIGGLGFCFGGKYVPHWLTGEGMGRGMDAGFIAHPSSLTEEEIGKVRGPLSVAAGSLDTAFNATAKFRLETIFNQNNVTYQSNVYSGAPHGFAVRVNMSVPQQAYAKQASFVQAVTWFDAWL